MPNTSILKVKQNNEWVGIPVINGNGVPAGGSTGQVLKKASGTDYDTEWAADSSGVDLGLTGATVGQIARITAVDANGKPTAWEKADVYPKKVFELEYTGNWHKCNVTAIDYSMGVITLADNDAPFTDDYNTAPMVWCVPLLEGVKGTYQWGYMPPELYDLYQSSSKRGVLVGTNQIKLYTSATASIDTITETSNVDLTRFQIWASSYMSNYPSTLITDLNSNHRYRIVCSAPHGGECSINVQLNGDVKSGEAFGYGYRNHTVGVSTQNIQATYNLQLNMYETISFRSIKHFNTDDKMFTSFPKHIVVDLFRVSNGSWQITGIAGYVGWDNKTISNISATDKPRMTNATIGAWLNDSIYSIIPVFNSNSGGSFAPLDGGRFTIFDMGEEY